MAPLMRGGELTATGVTKHYGGVTAVAGVDLHAPTSSVTAIIGPNGAGKTTLLNVLSGFTSQDGGSVRLNDLEIGGLSAAKRARLGVVRTFQNLRMYDGMTVYESVASVPMAGIGTLAPHWRHQRGVMTVLRRLQLDGVMHQQAADLPLLTQRRVEIARAIMAKPSVLLLDEPAAGATPKEADEIGGLIAGLAKEGIAIAIVEHNMNVVMEFAQTVHVMHLGSIICVGKPSDVAKEQAVRDVYLGT